MSTPRNEIKENVKHAAIFMEKAARLLKESSNLEAETGDPYGDLNVSLLMGGAQCEMTKADLIKALAKIESADNEQG